MLDELSGLTPRRLWLKKFEEKSGGVTIEGSAINIDDVSQFISALKGSKHFSEIQLKRTDAKPQDRLRTVDFTLNAKSTYTPGAKARSDPGKGK
jgi:type IV pilus assembly protein PilN